MTAGVAAQTSLGTATAGATAAIGAQSAALQSSAAAHNAHRGAARNNALAIMEVEHVGRAMIDAIASGRGVFTSLLMESGRLQIAFQNGLGGALGTVAQRALGLLSPMTPTSLAGRHRGSNAAHRWLEAGATVTWAHMRA